MDNMAGHLRIGAILALALALFAAPVHAAKYSIDWYLGHPNLDYFEEAATEFKKAVEVRSRGEIEVRIVMLDSDAYLGYEAAPKILSKVEKGEAQMGHSFTDVMGAADPRLTAFDAPFLFRGYRHLEGVFEGPVGAELLGNLLEKGIIGLAFTYSGGGSGIATVNREIRRPEDLRGLKVGVYGHAVNESWLRGLGATPVALGHQLNGVLGKVEEGALDAVVITWRNLEHAGLHHAFRFYNLPNSTFLVSMTYVNESWFNGLPRAYQDIIREESLLASRIERAKTIKLNEDAKAQMTAKGVRPVYLTKEGRNAFLQALKPDFGPVCERVIGKNLLERLKSTEDAPDLPWMTPDSFAVR